MLLYVWAVEQDELSKRVVPDAGSEPSSSASKAQDVLVPWVKTSPSTSSKPKPKSKPPYVPPSSPPPPSQQDSPPSQPQYSELSDSHQPSNTTPQIFQRYYHLFADSELLDLTTRAASELGIVVGDISTPNEEGKVGDGGDDDIVCGMEIVKTGWERSNYYLEARMWSRKKPGGSS